MKLWLQTVVLVSLAFCLGGGASAEETHEHEMPHGHAEQSGAAMSVAPVEPAPDSIYQLESKWTRSDGSEIELAALAGRIRVVAMVYTHCQHACPRIIADMWRLRSEVGEVGGRVGYVLVSLDPERDDVARLTEFAAAEELAEGWTLLRSDEFAVRELAAVLGIRYRRVSETDFVHSNLLTVLDRDGVVVHRQVGLGVDPKASAAAIRELLVRSE